MIDISFYEMQKTGSYWIQTISSPYVPRIGEKVALVDNDGTVNMFTCETVLSYFNIKSQTMSTPIKVYLRAIEDRRYDKRRKVE